MSEITAIQSKQHETKGKDKPKYKITWGRGSSISYIHQKTQHPDTKAAQKHQSKTILQYKWN